MKKEKKEILINEITIWKENKMLPLHYCDYLLALYTQGEESDELEKQAGHKRIHINTALFAILLMPIAVFILYFTELSFFLQTVILTSFVGCLLLLSIYLSRKKLLSPFLFLSAAVLLLLLTLEINNVLFSHHPYSLYALLCLNCLLWIYTGQKLKLFYFTASGAIGLMVILVFLINK